MSPLGLRCGSSRPQLVPLFWEEGKALWWEAGLTERWTGGNGEGLAFQSASFRWSTPLPACHHHGPTSALYEEITAAPASQPILASMTSLPWRTGNQHKSLYDLLGSNRKVLVVARTRNILHSPGHLSTWFPGGGTAWGKSRWCGPAEETWPQECADSEKSHPLSGCSHCCFTLTVEMWAASFLLPLLTKPLAVDMLSDNRLSPVCNPLPK